MRLSRLLRIIDKRPLFFLGIGILLYVVIFTVLSFWKYDNFLYNALDLGIYAQVFESFRNGNFWYSSIQQSSYLGDHFEPFILALLPFYFLIPHPKSLLVLQTFFLALPAIPIFFIARYVILSASEESKNLSRLLWMTGEIQVKCNNQSSKVISQKSSVNLWPLSIAFFYLLNPLVHNINLFEFHLLPFSLIFIFSAAYFYIKKDHGLEIRDYGFFLLFCFLALLTREDVPLIIFMFGALALIERRRWYWIIGPMILSVWWFLLSMKIISAFNIEGSYKFLTYYSWIFQASPFEFIARIYGTTDNWVMVLGFLPVFLFFPIFKTRFLILALPPFLQFALVSGGNGGAVFTMHYAVYFLPALFLASIFGIKRLLDYIRIDHFKNKTYSFVFKDRGLLITIISIAIIGLIIFFGPLGNFIPYFSIDKKRVISSEETKIQKAMINMIPASSSALLSSAYLPWRFTSQSDSALYWTFKGSKQFSSSPYIPPYSTDYALIDSEDLYGFAFSLKEYENGDNRIRNFIKERKLFVRDYADRFILFSKKPTEELLYKTLDSLPENINTTKDDQPIDKNSQIELMAYAQPEFFQFNLSDNQFPAVSFSLFWKKTNNTGKIYAVNVSLRDKRGKNIINKNYPLGYGLYPASDWEFGKIIQTNHRVLIPDDLSGEYKIYLKLIDATGGKFVLDHIRSAAVSAPDKPLGEEILLGKFTAPYK